MCRHSADVDKVNVYRESTYSASKAKAYEKKLFSLEKVILRVLRHYFFAENGHLTPILTQFFECFSLQTIQY